MLLSLELTDTQQNLHWKSWKEEEMIFKKYIA